MPLVYAQGTLDSSADPVTLGPMSRRSDVHPSLGLVLVRATAGGLFLGSGRGWLGAPNPEGPAIAALVQSAAADLPGPLAWWGRVVLLENPDALAFLWPRVLTLSGLGLLLGFLVRPLGVLAAVALTHALVFGREEVALLHLCLAAMALASALSQAGRRIGLDGALLEALPNWMTWSSSTRR